MSFRPVILCVELRQRTRKKNKRTTTATTTNLFYFRRILLWTQTNFNKHFTQRIRSNIHQAPIWRDFFPFYIYIKRLKEVKKREKKFTNLFAKAEKSIKRNFAGDCTFFIVSSSHKTEASKVPFSLKKRKKKNFVWVKSKFGFVLCEKSM